MNTVMAMAISMSWRTMRAVLHHLVLVRAGAQHPLPVVEGGIGDDLLPCRRLAAFLVDPRIGDDPFAVFQNGADELVAVGIPGVEDIFPLLHRVDDQIAQAGAGAAQDIDIAGIADGDRLKPLLQIVESRGDIKADNEHSQVGPVLADDRNIFRRQFPAEKIGEAQIRLAAQQRLVAGVAVFENGAERAGAIFLFHAGGDSYEIVPLADENRRHSAGLRGEGIDGSGIEIEHRFAVAQGRNFPAIDVDPASVVEAETSGKLRTEERGQLFGILQDRPAVDHDDILGLCHLRLELRHRHFFGNAGRIRGHQEGHPAESGENDGGGDQAQFSSDRHILERHPLLHFRHGGSLSIGKN